MSPPSAQPAKELTSTLPSLPPTTPSPAPTPSSSELFDKDEKKLDDSPETSLAPGEYNPAVTGHPWRIKGPTLLLVLFLTLGSNFASSSISPLKSTLKRELGVDNAQYANLDTADSLINTVLPILSGIAIDYFGPIAGALYSSIVILLGTILAGVAASTRSYPLFLVANIITGLGSSTIETSQSKLYSFYCLGGGIMGFVYGLDIGIGRVYNLAGKLSAVPIMEGTGSYAWTFWVSAILCAFTFLLTVSLALYERTFPACARVPTGRQAAVFAAKQLAPGQAPASFGRRWKEERKYFVMSLMALPACFWIMDVSQLLQAGAVNAYTSNLADAISTTRNKSKAAAGYTSAIGQIIPIVLTPCLGMIFDRFGRRMHWVTWTASLYVLVFALLAYTTVQPLVPSILGSLALATNVLPWIASIPLLVPDQARLGTAFGVYKSLNSCGSVIVTVAAGAIQDRTKPGRTEYNTVFAFLIAIKAFDVLLGLSYNLFDKRYLHGVLRSNDKQLRRLEEEMSEEERLSGLRKPIKAVTVAALGVVGAMIVTAWVLYLVYAV
ncbi:hypothetical protein NBRC10512_003768 [Rhodotorula toruloides]|uniref:Lysosomal dipeptide transporter MFSD1 n=2 Tax=Rhodotorula toruloides TaxID=5286 RepID=A0A061BAU2_RHOTO|nr:MFS transporter [Rhodotorula toruloides NP11]EMS22357.1 MFS transporter [Rhodotorula toruloides NP11]CDR47052.1 RHTO0S13e05270g1_1 [Rhodotorula toruloides]